MFTYLQGIRPKDRRSLMPPVVPSELENIEQRPYDGRPDRDWQKDADFAKQDYQVDQIAGVDGITIPFDCAASDRYAKSSPLQKDKANRIDNGKVSALHGERPRDEEHPIATSDARSSHKERVLKSTSEERTASGRPKRAIDLKFEQMQAYAEPPFRQSIYSQPHSLVAPIQVLKAAPRLSAGQASQPYTQSNAVYDEKHHDFKRPSSRQGEYMEAAQPGPSFRLRSDSEDVVRDPGASSHRHGKTRLHLKNPLTLLARRKAQHLNDTPFSESNIQHSLPLPDDYDPRIRGKVVHDFSTPRGERRGATSGKDEIANMSDISSSAKSIYAHRDGSPGRERTLFVERFDDDQAKTLDATTRSDAFLHQMALQASQKQPDHSQLPEFARRLPSELDARDDRKRSQGESAEISSLTVLPELPDSSQFPDSITNLTPPSRVPSAQSSGIEGKRRSSGTPERFKSNASRFSFDLAGNGSATQEKLLEDKHRQHTERTQRQSMGSEHDQDQHYEDSIYDEMNDEDAGDLEERIPGVNCDDDDDLDLTEDMGVRLSDCQQVLSGTLVPTSPDKSSFESTASPVSTGVTSLDTARDVSMFTPILAVSLSSPDLENLHVSRHDDVSPRPKSLPGPIVQAYKDQEGLRDSEPSKGNERLETKATYTFNDDDIYFDDGILAEIGEHDGIDDAHFDESVFDNNDDGVYGKPLRDRALIPNSSFQNENGDKIVSQTGDYLLDFDEPNGFSKQGPLMTDGPAEGYLLESTVLGDDKKFNEGIKVSNSQPAFDFGALSTAVNQAALDGAFDRNADGADALGPAFDARNVTWADGEDTFSGNATGAFDDDENDDLADDSIIAAANAEALENDDDGFYGQEFGFFARAPSTGETEYVDGGFFGPRALEAIHRSHSGKANFQEPSLTPITERSEFSNRNSAISLAMMNGHPYSNIPANTQKFDSVPMDDVASQLAMLKKIRQGAFGGGGNSTGPHSNSSSPQNGSPLTGAPPSSYPTFGHSASSSASTNMPPPPRPSSSSAKSAPRTSHTRNSSGAESISYVEEGGKWVLEKRRMSESGQQILGRTIVEGGRI